MKTAFHRVIANVRAALEQRPVTALHVDGPQASMPVAETAKRAELASEFAREIELVGGHFMGTLGIDELKTNVAGCLRELDVKSVAIGRGVTSDLGALAKAITREGMEVIEPHPVTADTRADLRSRIAKADAAIVEADYGIASTGTFAVVARPESPSSLTLLPPVNIIVVSASRILPDLASVMATLGPSTISANRVALITGPSRTADIEKMIVIGVHGPKQLYAAAIWD
jgi:L-lactate dehydrogenase complex protein LldG